jgi:hypothetical protein
MEYSLVKLVAFWKWGPNTDRREAVYHDRTPVEKPDATLYTRVTAARQLVAGSELPVRL